MKFAREKVIDTVSEYRYDEIKKRERKKQKEFRDKRKNKHNSFLTTID